MPKNQSILVNLKCKSGDGFFLVLLIGRSVGKPQAVYRSRIDFHWEESVPAQILPSSSEGGRGGGILQSHPGSDG